MLTGPNSCASWATAHTLAGWYAKFTGQKVTKFAPMYLYTQVNGGGDNGSSLQAPLDDGGEWDFNLQEQEEEAGDRWYTLTLSMGGSPQFCAAFRQRFVYA